MESLIKDGLGVARLISGNGATEPAAERVFVPLLVIPETAHILINFTQKLSTKSAAQLAGTPMHMRVFLAPTVS